MNVIENVNKVSEIIDADEWYVKNAIKLTSHDDVIIARDWI